MSFMFEYDNREVADEFIRESEYRKIPLTEMQKLVIRNELRYGTTSGVKNSIDNGKKLEYAKSANPIDAYIYDVKITTMYRDSIAHRELIEPSGKIIELQSTGEK